MTKRHVMHFTLNTVKTLYSQTVNRRFLALTVTKFRTNAKEQTQFCRSPATGPPFVKSLLMIMRSALFMTFCALGQRLLSQQLISFISTSIYAFRISYSSASLFQQSICRSNLRCEISIYFSTQFLLYCLYVDTSLSDSSVQICTTVTHPTYNNAVHAQVRKAAGCPIFTFMSITSRHTLDARLLKSI